MTEHSADTVERVARRLYEADYPTAVQTGSWTDQGQLRVARYENLARIALSALTVEDAAKVLPDAEWRQTNGMIYNLVDSATDWENGERPKINQYMINFSRQNSAGGSDGELSELQAFVFAALRAIADTPKEELK